MKARKAVIILLFLLLLCVLNATQQTVFEKGRFNVYPEMDFHKSKLDTKCKGEVPVQVWSNNCEDSAGWDLSSVWQIGAPSFGPQNAPQGQGCLGTNLSGFYPNTANALARSQTIQLPAASYIELKFKEWFELESDYDFGYLEVQVGSSTSRIDARTGTSNGLWRETALNLSRYQNQQITLVFKLNSDASVPGAGWYVDDLQIGAVEPLEMELHISSVNIANLPSVYLTAAVDSPSGHVTDLITSNFSITENEVLQDNLFTVITPDDEALISTADIVFVLDVTGSMHDEIESVRYNMQNFMTFLNSQNVDYRIGFVVFGDIVYVYNQYSFYTDFAEIMGIINTIMLGEHGIGSGEDFPENQLEAMAEGSVFNWRPGASRVMIMLTDATAHQADSVTSWTVGDLLAQRLIPNNIVAFPIFDINNTASQQQYIPIAEQTNPNGTYYHIYDNFNGIIQEIGAYISSLYTIHYQTAIPIADPMTRAIKLTATMDNSSAEAYAYYLPGISPTIERSPALLALDTVSVPANTALTVSVQIADRVAPLIESATLFWRRSGITQFTQTALVPSGNNTYQAIIPAALVSGAFIEYYLAATDGQTSITLPSSEPQDRPFSLAIAPNAHASFSNASAQYSLATGFQISLDCGAPNMFTLELNYRPIGSLAYVAAAMNGTIAAIDEDLGTLGVEYYICCTQTNGLKSYFGNSDNPLRVMANSAMHAQSGWANEIRDNKVFPNPVYANSRNSAYTNICFMLVNPMQVTLNIYNLKGQLIRVLADEMMDKGDRTCKWDFRDKHGRTVSSGLYLYRISNANHAVSGKIMYSK